MTVRELLKQECEKSKYNYDCETDDDLAEFFLDAYYYKNDKVVWRDPNIDEHRWFDIQNKVFKVGEFFVLAPTYSLKSEGMGFWDIYTSGKDFLNDLKIVERKERVIKEVYYE